MVEMVEIASDLAPLIPSCKWGKGLKLSRVCHHHPTENCGNQFSMEPPSRGRYNGNRGNGEVEITSDLIPLFPGGCK